MTSPLHPPSPRPPPRDLPDHWSPSARDLVTEVLNESPDLLGASLVSLYQAAELVSMACVLDKAARLHGLVSKGAREYSVSPAVIESRLARMSAIAILNTLRPDAAISSHRSPAP